MRQIVFAALTGCLSLMSSIGHADTWADRLIESWVRQMMDSNLDRKTRVKMFEYAFQGLDWNFDQALSARELARAPALERRMAKIDPGADGVFTRDEILMGLGRAFWTGADVSRQVHQVRTGRTMRSYTVVMPAQMDKTRAYPVLIAFHGEEERPGEFASRSGLDQMAADDDAVLVYPQGVMRSFNAGTCCGAARRRGVDEKAFFAQMLEHLGDQVGVDTSRVYLVGYANGAILAQELAVHNSERIEGVVAVAGTFEGAVDSGGVPILQVHGTNDRAMPYEGGYGGLHGGEGRGFPSVGTTLEGWRLRNECSPDAVVQRDPRAHVVRVSWDECARGASVTHWRIEGGEHSWPAADRLDLYEEIRTFLRQGR